MRPSATDWVCLYPCVCVSVGHDREPSKTANTVWAADSSGPKEPRIIWRLGFPIRRATLGGTGTQESKTHARRSQKGWEAGVCTLTWRCKDCAAGVRSVATITCNNLFALLPLRLEISQQDSCRLSPTLFMPSDETKLDCFAVSVNFGDVGFA